MGRFYRADIRKLSVSYNWEPNQANQSEEHIQSAILRKRKDNGNYKSKEKKGEVWWRKSAEEEEKENDDGRR